MPLGTCLTTERYLVTHAITPPRTEPQAPAAGAWYQTKAPARLRPLALLVATITSGTALVILVAVGTGMDRTVLIPPLPAGMALVGGASSTPLGQPRNGSGSEESSV